MKNSVIGITPNMILSDKSPFEYQQQEIDETQNMKTNKKKLTESQNPNDFVANTQYGKYRIQFVKGQKKGEDINAVFNFSSLEGGFVGTFKATLSTIEKRKNFQSIIAALEEKVKDSLFTHIPTEPAGELDDYVAKHVKNYHDNPLYSNISESKIRDIVRKTLSEMDWKTYDNAAAALYNKAREGYGKYPNGEIPMDSEHGKFFQRAERLKSHANDKFRQDYGEANYKTNPKGSEEFLHQVNGDYDYVKGQGYVLKNDSLRDTIRETVKKTLKENFQSRYFEDIQSAKEYDDGDIEIWMDENCDDDMPWEVCKQIWLMAHPSDKNYI